VFQTPVSAYKYDSLYLVGAFIDSGASGGMIHSDVRVLLYAFHDADATSIGES
jgi:hypothetical protein